MREYADRDVIAQGEFYIRHVNAMTVERLHDKSDIAAELAHRDIAIVQLRARVAELEAERVRLVKSAREAWDERAKAQTFATNCRNRAERAEADLAAARAQYNELIMAVASKHPNESRHETALRYIRQRENGSPSSGADALAGKDAT